MVREAIASVLAQHGADYELIVVDDGSTDGTIDELAPHAAHHGYRLIRAAHRGPAGARNLGAAAARGEFVAFLDSDDLWMPTKLARQLAFMRARPSLSISQCDEHWTRNGRRVNPGLRHRKQAGDFFAASLRTCLVSPSAVIMRTALFHALGGFDEGLAACEDYDLWLRIGMHEQIGLLEETLVVRRAGHPDQLSATTPALDRFRIIALMKLLAGKELTAARRSAVCDVLIEKCAIYGGGLERRGRDDAARLCRSIVRQAASWRAAPDATLEESIAVMRAAVHNEHVAAATEAMEVVR